MDWVKSLRQFDKSSAPRRPCVRTKGRLCRPVGSGPALRTQARAPIRSPLGLRTDGSSPVICKFIIDCKQNAKISRVYHVINSLARRRWGPPQVIIPECVSDVPDSYRTPSTSPSLRTGLTNRYSKSVDIKEATCHGVNQILLPRWVERNHFFSRPFHTGLGENIEDPEIHLQKALCKAGVNPELKTLSKVRELAREDALISATREALPALVSALLDTGVDPEATSARRAADHDAWTPLHWAAYESRLHCAGLLLRAGAYVDATSTSGLTPLHVAAIHDRGDCAYLLLHAGADFKARDHAGRTPCCYGGSSFEGAMDAFLHRPS